MVDARYLHCVVDVFDDLCVVHTGQNTFHHVLARDAIAFNQHAAFVGVAAAPLGHFLRDGFVDLRISFFGIAEFLAQKSNVIVDLHYAALGRQISHHLVGHVAWRIANRAAGRMRSKKRRFARFQRIVKSLVAHVGNINNHTEAIHFTDDVFSEIG